jgi:hypothetical protein
MKLKILTCSLLAATLGAMFALPAFAQEVNPQAEQQLRNWMARDPRLEADPGLMDNPTYLRNHPNFATWLSQHPNVHQQVERMGAYDNNHQWHSANWWHQNNPNWVAQNHPEWAGNHPEWEHPNPGGPNHPYPAYPAHPGAPNAAAYAHDNPQWAAHNEAVVQHHEERVEHREEAVHNYEEHHNQH